MELDFKKKVEVEALASMLDELDYYRLLKLKQGAPIPDVEKAYATQSKNFHPDRFFGVRDPKFTKQVTAVFKKISEAYQVLKDPELKKMYDQKMGFRASDGASGGAGGGGQPEPTGIIGGVGKAELEAERAAARAAGDDMVADKRARKYWDLAQIAWNNEDWNGVVMNLQFAQSFEKENPNIKKRLADAKQRLEDKKKKNLNPYKIKIV
jgi:curved DNA-binding protein CbpA